MYHDSVIPLTLETSNRKVDEGMELGGISSRVVGMQIVRRMNLSALSIDIISIWVSLALFQPLVVL